MTLIQTIGLSLSVAVLSSSAFAAKIAPAAALKRFRDNLGSDHVVFRGKPNVGAKQRADYCEVRVNFYAKVTSGGVGVNYVYSESGLNYSLGESMDLADDAAFTVDVKESDTDASTRVVEAKVVEHIPAGKTDWGWWTPPRTETKQFIYAFKKDNGGHYVLNAVRTLPGILESTAAKLAGRKASYECSELQAIGQ